MEKFISIEHTFSKQEIETILSNHLHAKLMKEDVDYKEATIANNDFTYHFKDDSPSIFSVILLNVGFRSPKKKR